ncbi:putative UPF0471 protein C1orf63-like protein [Triplophysa rosa]|uniref:UPF0471 protein C1orf63-like protein n=1 Tax=Triplophysa rosa TaxID=992332 RepID=A0A9W8C7Y1_TRIRA|nr:putative UPF0471 protein C1orf63-like protein [Triplophysa rosa]
MDLFQQALHLSPDGAIQYEGEGKKGMKHLEKTQVCRAMKDGVMKFDDTATEDFMGMNASEHLKHAPQRSEGHAAATQD